MIKFIQPFSWQMECNHHMFKCQFYPISELLFDPISQLSLIHHIFLMGYEHMHINKNFIPPSRHFSVLWGNASSRGEIQQAESRILFAVDRVFLI